MGHTRRKCPKQFAGQEALPDDSESERDAEKEEEGEGAGHAGDKQDNDSDDSEAGGSYTESDGGGKARPAAPKSALKEGHKEGAGGTVKAAGKAKADGKADGAVTLGRQPKEGAAAPTDRNVAWGETPGQTVERHRKIGELQMRCAPPPPPVLLPAHLLPHAHFPFPPSHQPHLHTTPTGSPCPHKPTPHVDNSPCGCRVCWPVGRFNKVVGRKEDVSSDGWCWMWAILHALGLMENPSRPTENDAARGRCVVKAVQDKANSGYRPMNPRKGGEHESTVALWRLGKAKVSSFHVHVSVVCGVGWVDGHVRSACQVSQLGKSGNLR